MQPGRNTAVPRPDGAGVAYGVQAERIVALLRLPAIVVIAAGESLGSSDDTAWYPSPEHLPFFVALIGYLVLGAGVLVWVYARPVGSRFALVTATLDIAAITALTVSSGGPYSQTRLAYFIVPVVAAFRFRPAVTAIAAGAGVAAYLAQSFGHPASHQPEAARFIGVHAAYLTWVGLAAVLLSALLQRRTRLVWSLAESRESLLNELLTAEDRERQALAEGLHDHAVQNLLSVRHELEEAATAGGRGALERADEAVMETVSELREIVSTLHPHILATVGLAPALRLTAQQAARRGDFTVRVDVDAGLDTDGAAAEDDRLLLRAARELLANAATHSQARHVAVRLSRDARETRLAVSDDGVGFDLERLSDHLAQGHIGLASQRLRIESAGGSLDVVSVPGEGSTVVVRLPRRADGGLPGRPRKEGPHVAAGPA